MDWILLLLTFMAGSWLGMFAMAIFSVSADADRIDDQREESIKKTVDTNRSGSLIATDTF